MMDRYTDLRERLSRLNNPEARFELGEDARRAQLAALADQYLEELLESHDRYLSVLYPRVVEQEKEARMPRLDEAPPTKRLAESILRNYPDGPEPREALWADYAQRFAEAWLVERERAERLAEEVKRRSRDSVALAEAELRAERLERAVRDAVEAIPEGGSNYACAMLRKVLAEQEKEQP